MRELGLLATHGFIKNSEMYKRLSSSRDGRTSFSSVGYCKIRLPREDWKRVVSFRVRLGLVLPLKLTTRFQSSLGNVIWSTQFILVLRAFFPTPREKALGMRMYLVLSLPWKNPISFPEPANFLWRMLDENEGDGKDLLNCITFQTRLALASVLGPFGVHLQKFTLPTPMHWCTIWGYWNFRLEFVMPHTTHPRPTYDYNLWKHVVFRLLLALFWLVGLSKRRIIEPSLTAFTGFPSALLFTCMFMECIT